MLSVKPKPVFQVVQFPPNPRPDPCPVVQQYTDGDGSNSSSCSIFQTMPWHIDVNDMVNTKRLLKKSANHERQSVRCISAQERRYYAATLARHLHHTECTPSFDQPKIQLQNYKKKHTDIMLRTLDPWRNDFTKASVPHNHICDGPQCNQIFLRIVSPHRLGWGPRKEKYRNC